MREKSIYELALEEIDKQRLKKARKRFVKKKRRRRRRKPKINLEAEIDPEELRKVIENAKEIDIHFDGPSSVPPNVRRSLPRDVLLDGASNRGWGRSGGSGRNIQLD